MAEYRKHMETRIIRTEHRVTLWTGTYSTPITTALRHVPLNAKLTDIETGDGSRIILIFTDEAEDQKAAPLP